MKYARLAAGAVELASAPEPVVGPGEVAIELAACGICGTDVEKLRGGYTRSQTLGHEPVGRVRAIGTGVSGIEVGDRVFAHHHVGCGSCRICRQGDPTFCPSYATTNLRPGGFAEVFVVPAANVRAGAVLKLADSVSWETGTLLEPAGCAETALRRVGGADGRAVFVVGLGPVGLLYARVARAHGAAWVGGAEISERRRAAAAQGGIDATVDPRTPGEARSVVDAATDGTGVDLAVVATAAPAAVRLALELVRSGGTVNLFGLPEATDRLDTPLQQLYLRGVRIIPSYATTEADIRTIHSWVADGTLSLGDLVSHRLPLERVADAFALAARPAESLRVVVTGPAMSPGD